VGSGRLQGQGDTAAVDPDPDHVDGRLLRSIRTRDKVIDAFLALVAEGDLSPTAQRVAGRAEVSLRTVFHQFEDLETLHRLAGERLRERVAALTEPIDPHLPLADRTAAFARHRVRVLTALHPVASAARLREPASQTLRDNRDALLSAARATLEQVFRTELDSLAEPARARVLTALGLVTSWGAWWQLREECGLEEAEAEAVMRTGLAALLAGLPAARATS
jgi:TetR/AcrR family transcriptional regulator of autoinduction and epiphytic fitness